MFLNFDINGTLKICIVPHMQHTFSQLNRKGSYTVNNSHGLQKPLGLVYFVCITFHIFFAGYFSQESPVGLYSAKWLIISIHKLLE